MPTSYSKATEGVALLCDPDGGLIEVKTVTCGHCQRIMHVSPFGDCTGEVVLPAGSEHTLVSQVKREPPAVCHRCWTLVCPICHKDGRCLPFIKQMEAFEEKRLKMENRQAFFRSAGLG